MKANVVRPLGLKIIPKRAPLRSSGWKTYNQCARKYLFQERFGLKPRGEYVPALELGKFCHNIVTGLYAGHEFSALVKQTQKLMEQKAGELWDTAQSCGGLLPGGNDPIAAIEQMKKDFQKAVMMAQVLHQHFPPNFKDLQIVPVLTEKLLYFQYPGLKAPQLSRLDGVLHDPKKNQLWILDLKTTSATTNTVDLAASYLLASQPWFYKLQLENLMDPKPKVAFPIWFDDSIRKIREGSPTPKVMGMYHIVIQKPNYRVKQSETFDGYVERCKTDFYEANLKKFRDGDIYSPPILVSRTRMGDLPSWFDNLIRRYADAARRVPHVSKFPPNDSSCFMFNRKCPFLSICQTDEPLWPSVVEGSFVQEFREIEEYQDLANYQKQFRSNQSKETSK